MEDTNPQGSVPSIESRIASLLDSHAAPEGSEDRREDSPEPEASPEPEELPEGPESVEGEPEGESEVTEPEPEVQEPSRTWKVGDAEVTEDELVKGYMRQADYTRKTQEAASLRKESEAEKSRVAQERQRYADALQYFESQIPKVEAPSPELLDQDPIEFLRQQNAYQQSLQNRQALAVERQRVEQQANYEREQAAQALIRDEAAKLESRLPEWANPEKRSALIQGVQQEMRERGFSDTEISQLAYAHHFEVVNDARKWRAHEAAMKAKKPLVEKKVRDAPEVVKPGTATNRNSKEEMQAKARARLKKTGRVEDAAAILAMSLQE